MKIAQISKADAAGGGASRVAEDLANILRINGHISHHWMGWSSNGFDFETKFPIYGGHARLFSKCSTLIKKIGYPELIPFELLVLKRKNRINNYDLWHFHDLSSAISPFTLLSVSQYRPVVWTLHDCSPITGGCIQPRDCANFKTGCGRCPQSGCWPIDSWFDRTHTSWKIKKYLHNTNRIHLITPSNWMADMAVDSGMVSIRPTVIPNGVDVDLYHPIDKQVAKRSFGLPTDRPVIILSAWSVSDVIKGTDFALRALESIKDLKPYLLVIGNMDSMMRNKLADFDYLSVGYVSNKKIMAYLDAMADIFLFCSIADNLPLTILENMSCGTPMVGFATGGIPEMINQDVDGMLVPPKDEAHLAEVLRYAIEKNRYSIWGENARNKAVNNFSMSIFYEKHLAYYKNLLETV